MPRDWAVQPTPSSPHIPFHQRIVAVLLSRPVGATAGVLTALIFLGCMSISIGKFGSTCTVDGLVEHEGETEVQGGAEQDVYYPIPYATIPNLVLKGNHSSAFVIVEQREDHFRVKNTSGECQEIQWKARGLRASPCASVPAGTPPPPLAPTPAPAAELPSTPVPYTRPDPTPPTTR